MTVRGIGPERQETVTEQMRKRFGIHSVRNELCDERGVSCSALHQLSDEQGISCGALRKLRSERGISLLYGLMFFFVAFMVAAVIIHASLAAIQRVHSDQEFEQGYLALRSAGQLLGECLEETTFELVSESDTTGRSEEYITSEGTLSSTLRADIEAITKPGSGAASAGQSSDGSGSGSSGQGSGTGEGAQDGSQSGGTGAGASSGDRTGTIPIQVGNPADESAKAALSATINYTLFNSTHSNEQRDEHPYGIAATITLPNSDQKLYFVAWGPLPTPSTTTSTQTFIDEETGEETEITTTTTRSTISWTSYKLTTQDGGAV